MVDVPSRVQADLRALTVKQPHADLEIAGVKTVENRSKPVPSTIADVDPDEPPLWECPYYRKQAGLSDPGIGDYGEATCSFGCYDEPACVTGGPLPFPFRLWIHAAKEADHDNTDWETHWLPLNGQDERWLTNDRYGALLGPVTVTSQHHADECAQPKTEPCRCLCHHGHARHAAACCEGGRVPAPHRGFRFCSPFAEPDRWHYVLSDPRPLATPIPVRGQQGWWRLSDDLKAAIAEQEEA